MSAEIETAAELVRIAFAWSYAEDRAEEAALEQKLDAMIADLDPEERHRIGWRYAMLAERCRRHLGPV